MRSGGEKAAIDKTMNDRHETAVVQAARAAFDATDPSSGLTVVGTATYSDFKRFETIRHRQGQVTPRA